MAERRPERIQRSRCIHPIVKSEPPAVAGGEGNGRAKRSERNEAANRREGRRWSGGTRQRDCGCVEGSGPRGSEGIQGPATDAGLEIDLSRLARTFGSAQSLAGGSVERLSSSPSGKDQSRRGALSIHLGHGRNDVLSFHRLNVHWRAVDVLLPP